MFESVRMKTEAMIFLILQLLMATDITIQCHPFLKINGTEGMEREEIASSMSGYCDETEVGVSNQQMLGADKINSTADMTECTSQTAL